MPCKARAIRGQLQRHAYHNKDNHKCGGRHQDHHHRYDHRYSRSDHNDHRVKQAVLALSQWRASTRQARQRRIRPHSAPHLSRWVYSLETYVSGCETYDNSQ